MVATDDQQSRAGDTVRLDRAAPEAIDAAAPADDLQDMLEEVPIRTRRERTSAEPAPDEPGRSSAQDSDPLNRVAPAPDVSFDQPGPTPRAGRQRRVRRYNIFLDELLPWVLVGLGLIPVIIGGWGAMTLAQERWAMVAVALAVVGCAFVFVQVPLSSIGMHLLARVRGIDLPDRVAFRVAAILLMLSGSSFLAQQVIGPAGAIVALVLWVPASLVLVWLLFHLTWLEALLGWLISGVFAVLGTLATVLVVAGVMFVVGLIMQPAGPARRPPRITPPPTVQVPPARSNLARPSRDAEQTPAGHDPQMRRVEPAEEDAQAKSPPQPSLPDLAELAVMVPTDDLQPRVVAAMREMARGDQPVARRLDAIAVLERWSGQPATGLWIDLLADSDPAMRQAAIERLSKTTEAQAIGPILDLHDRHPQSVRRAIGLYGSAAELPLLQQIRQADPEAQVELLALLDPIATDQSQPLLRALVHSPDAGVAANARQLIMRIAPGSFDPLEALVADLSSGNRQVQRRALGELAVMEGTADRRDEVARAVEPLVVGEDESLHDAAAVALGRWARPDSFDFLHQYLDEAEDDPAKRRPAMIAIGHLGGQQAVDPLIRWLLLEPEVAGEALALVGEPAERPLIRLIRDDRAELAAGACEILGRIGGLRSKVALESLLRRPGIDPSVRRAAEASLESIGQRLSPPRGQGGD